MLHFRSVLYSVRREREGQKGSGRPTGRPMSFLERKSNYYFFFLKKPLAYQLAYHSSATHIPTHFPTRACSVHAPLITMTDMCGIIYCASASVGRCIITFSWTRYLSRNRKAMFSACYRRPWTSHTELNVHTEEVLSVVGNRCTYCERSCSEQAGHQGIMH